MDEDFNLWLIEVNTNPCIEESSMLLKYYLRRMIEDMIKLEIDPVFPNPKLKRKENIAKSKTSTKAKGLKQKQKSKKLKRRLSFNKSGGYKNTKKPMSKKNKR